MANDDESRVHIDVVEDSIATDTKLSNGRPIDEGQALFLSGRLHRPIREVLPDRVQDPAPMKPAKSSNLSRRFGVVDDLEGAGRHCTYKSLYTQPGRTRTPELRRTAMYVA